MQPQDGRNSLISEFSLESFVFYLSAISSSLGAGFQHGYNLAVLNSPQEVIEDWIDSLDITYIQQNDKVQTLYWASIVSIFAVGGILGGFISPLIIMMGGRRGGLIISAFIAIFAGGFMYMAKPLSNPMWLFIGRIVSGVNCGVNATICPIYLTEISPTNLRGALGSLYQLFITAAILAATFLGIEAALGSFELWPNLFIPNIVIAVLEILGLMWVPESPRYILDKMKNEAQAKRAFNRFHGHKATASQEFGDMKAEAEAFKNEPKITLKVFLTHRGYYKPLALCMFLMVAQQMSGINAVIFYSTDIFKKAMLSGQVSQLCTGAVGLTNFLATVFAVFVIDKSGRKPLIMWGFISMAVCTSLLTGLLYLTEHIWARWLSFIVVLIFVTSFAVGAGPIPWMLSSEVFHTNARPLAGAFIVPTNWIFNLIVGLGFPSIEEFIGPLVFLIFLVFQVISVLVIIVFMPETKNRNVEDIIQDFK